MAPNGLKNVGNTCFLNSVLQGLASVRSFYDYVENLSRQRNNTFSSSLFSTLKELQHEGQNSILTPKILSHEKLHGKIYLYEQQDAQEFFQHIMQLLEDEQKSNKDLEQTTGLWSSKDQANGIIFDATEDFSYLSKKNPFLGTFESEFLCTNCNRNRLSIENFLDIPLSIPREGRSVEYCLQKFNEAENIFGVHCTFCSAKGKESNWNTEKKLSVCSLPESLCINFRRLTMGLLNSSKNNCHIKFPKVLDMSPFRSSITCDKEQPVTYSLKAVVEHHGGSDGFSGHYTTFRNFFGNGWYLCNDERATKVAEAQVFAAKAYMLLYEKV